jgi:hypothetical protein
MKYQQVGNFKSDFQSRPKGQSPELLSQRCNNLLRVLMAFWFECKRDLYFSGGEIVESESEEVIGRTSERRLRAKHGEKEPRDLIGLRPL